MTPMPSQPSCEPGNGRCRTWLAQIGLDSLLSKEHLDVARVAAVDGVVIAATIRVFKVGLTRHKQGLP